MRLMRALVLGAAALVLVACQDMDVTNPNNPDTESVQASPGDLETLIATSWVGFQNRVWQNNTSLTAAVISGQFGGGFGCFGTLERSSEPRVPITTVPGAGNQAHFFPWRDWYGAVAQVNAGLRAIEEGDVVIRQDGNDVTARAQAFAKFVQGLAHGYVALSFDRGYVFSESIASDTLGFTAQNPQVQELIRPYPEVADTALAQLSAAIDIIRAHNVSIPSQTPERWISGYSLSPAEFEQLIHAYKARILAYLPRNRAEKEAVDWNRVLSHLDQGWQGDFAPEGSPGVVQHNFQRLTARQRATVPNDHIRPNYETIGVADQSGGFQEWWATPWSDRTPWTMEVEDLRIIDPDRTPIVSQADDGEGLYLGHHIANVWAAERGTAHRSYYYIHRFGRGNSWENGPLLTMAEAELDLIRAEAYMWLGQPEAAIPLINKTRVANGGLAPVTLEGAPMGDDGYCTPRKWNGECGSLWDALRWEKAIETMQTEGYISWWDRRGWQELVEGTEVHWPMPLQDQELLAIPVYTMGGGQGDSAPPPDPERCPPAVAHLPGCS
jgi:hypothetical protein